MKREDIVEGKLYACKVSGTVVPVKIIRDRGTKWYYNWRGTNTHRNVHDGYDAVNTRTGRSIHVRSAARLRREYNVTQGEYVWTLAHQAAIEAYCKVVVEVTVEKAKEIAESRKLSVQGIERSRQRAAARRNYPDTLPTSAAESMASTDTENC